MANAQGMPIAFILTPGNVADISVAAQLLEGIAPPRCLLADKAYGADHLRQPLEVQGTEVVIPPMALDADPTHSIGAPIAGATSSNACSAA